MTEIGNGRALPAGELAESIAREERAGLEERVEARAEAASPAGPLSPARPFLRRPARQTAGRPSLSASLWSRYGAAELRSATTEDSQQEGGTPRTEPTREGLKARRMELVQHLRQSASAQGAAPDHRAVRHLEAELVDVNRTLSALDSEPWALAETGPQKAQHVMGRKGADANPQEAVSHLLHDLEFAGATGAESRQIQADALSLHLSYHRGDARWHGEMLAHLGVDAYARLLDEVLSPEHYRGLTEQDLIAAVGANLEAIEGLYQAGKWSRGDFDALMRRWLGHDPSSPGAGAVQFNPSIALVMRGAQPGLRSAFFASAKFLALEPVLSEAMQIQAAAAAAYVLAGAQADEQVEHLVVADREGVLRPWVARAMRGPRLVPTLRSALDRGVGEKDPRRTLERSYDGLARLSFTLAYSDLYLREFAAGPPPFSQSELSRVRQLVMVEILSSLQEPGSHWIGNTMLKDALSVILRKEFDSLWRQSVDAARVERGETSDPTAKELHSEEGVLDPRFAACLDQFFAYSLFSTPSGSCRDTTSHFFSRLLSQWIKDISDVDFGDQRFAEIYGSRKVEVAGLVGELLGRIGRAAMKSLADEAVGGGERVASTAFDLLLALVLPNPVELGRQEPIGELAAETLLGVLAVRGEEEALEIGPETSVVSARQLFVQSLALTPELAWQGWPLEVARRLEGMQLAATLTKNMNRALGSLQ